jgi:hypothetical protein
MTTEQIMAGLVQAEHVLRASGQPAWLADACAAAWERLLGGRP